MDRVFQSGAIATPPSPPNAETSKGYPTNGSASGGISATIVGDHWYHGITEELLNAIKGGGVTPDINQLDQLNRSIENRINQRFNDLKKALEPVGCRCDGSSWSAWHPDWRNHGV